MKEIKIIEHPKGTFSCDIDISVEEWQDILLDTSLITSNYKKALMAFYDEPEHQSNCKALGVKYYGNAKDAQKFNAWISQFGIAVAKKLNRFKIVDEEGKERFWHVTMCKGMEAENGVFVTQLRPELVKAMENVGWNKSRTWIPFYQEFADKLLDYKDDRKALLEIVYGLDSQFVGYIRGKDGDKVKDIDPFTVFAIFNRGVSYAKRIKLIEYFKDKFSLSSSIPTDFDGVPIVNNMLGTFFWRKHMDTDIPQLWNLYEAMIKCDEEGFCKWFDIVSKQQGIKWNVTMGLFWARPYDYISLDSRNREYLPALGIKVFGEKNIDSKSYLSLLQSVKDKIKTQEIGESTIPEISYNAWAKNMECDVKIWFSRDSDKENFKYCLQEKCLFFNGSNSLGNMSLLGNTIEEFGRSLSTEKTFNKTTVHYTYWQLSHEVEEGDIIIYFKTPSEIYAWGVVCSPYVYDDKKKYHSFLCVDWHVVDNIKDSPVKHSTSLWFKEKKVGEVFPLFQSLGIELQSRNKDNIGESYMKYQEYIDLLTENHNLILTGAPGTGKTYMAKEIAEEMGAETEFVQFHPSYDYTDFVEGLRPIEKGDDQVGFRRMDGIFKRFCKKAIFDDVTEDNGVLEKLNSDPKVWKVSLEKTYENPTRTDCLRNGYIRIGWDGYGDVEDFNDMQDFSDGGRTILRAFQSEMQIGDIVVSCYSQNETDAIGIVTGDYEYREEGGALPRYRTVEWLIKNVKINITDVIGKKMTLSTVYKLNVSVPKILEIVKKNGSLKKPISQSKKPYVMIIDEINRGELSKIFGELFSAIDPGYRGTKGEVKTQYQNLVEEGDVFAKGFYVPENVYILATMNDIDRSVESMDFAMRRRFTWKEVTPDERAGMLDDELDSALAMKAKVVMARVNKEIAKTDGLGEAFMIGPSYFLKLKKYNGDFAKLWKLNIEPLLKEYLRGFRKAGDILADFKSAYFDENGSVSNSDEVNEEVLDNED